MDPVYAWFVATVWPDPNGVPTAVIREWDRSASQQTETVHVVRFDVQSPFLRQIEALGYEMVEAQITEPVTPHGVLIALRREVVPVYVYA